MKSEARTTASKMMPTPIASGRFRPARPGGGGASGAPGGCGTPGAGGGLSGTAGGISGTGGGISRTARVRPRRREPRGDLSFDTASDLEQFGFLVLKQVVDLGDIPMGQLVELLLGAPDLVLACLAILG
jgi:hypothetical protein